MPNGIGFLLGSVQLILYIIYYKSKPAKEDGEGGDIEMKDATFPNTPSLSFTSNSGVSPRATNDIQIAVKQQS